MSFISLLWVLLLVIKLDKEDELISGCLLSDEGVVLQNNVFEN